MNITYTITATGYQLLQDGKVWVDQPFDPSQVGFVPFASPADAEAAAKAEVAALQAA